MCLHLTSLEWQAALLYVCSTWENHASRFVKCFVDLEMHLGTASTSRGEDNNYLLKRYIKIANGDFLMVYKRQNIMLRTQFIELHQLVEAEKVFIALHHATSNMNGLLGLVLKFAFQRVHEQGEAACTHNGD
jgi:hypothetical protein